MVDSPGKYKKFSKCHSIDNFLYFTAGQVMMNIHQKMLKTAHRQQREKQIKSYCIMGEGIQRKNTMCIQFVACLYQTKYLSENFFSIPKINLKC